MQRHMEFVYIQNLKIFCLEKYVRVVGPVHSDFIVPDLISIFLSFYLSLALSVKMAMPQTLFDKVWIIYHWQYNFEHSLLLIVPYKVYNRRQTRIFIIKHKTSKNYVNIFHIYDGIKVSRIPLWIGLCHFCIQDCLK